MSELNGNEAALLELLAMKPLSYLPPLHLGIAENLKQRGLLRRRGKFWYPTAVGLAQTWHVLH